jgi:exosortase
MSATSTVQPVEPVESEASRIPWAPIALCSALLLLGYLPVFLRLIKVWSDDEDMGHGFLVIPVALYIIWLRREDWVHLPAKWDWLGLALILAATGQLVVATLGAEFFLARSAFILSLGGILLFVGGWPLLKQFLFPIAILVFMIPIPEIIYNQITFPLQMFASQVAERALDLLGVPVYREGNILELPSQRLSVVEACSGIRSLLSLSFLSLAYGFFSEKRTWMRWVLFLMTVPIAVVTNAGPVTATGLVSEYDPKLAQGIFHTMEGMVSWGVAMVLLVAFHFLLTRLVGGDKELGGSKHVPAAV